MARHSGSARALRDERRSEVQERLVETLKRMIASEPRFTEITLSRLLSETGLSRTSFYKYFDSKTDVLAAWFDETIARLLDAPRPNSGEGAPARDDLEASFAAVADVYRRELPLLIAVYETAAHDFDMRERLRHAIDELEGRVRRHFLRGKREGWVNQAIDPEAMAAWVVSLGESGLRHIVGPSKKSAVEAAVTGFVDILWFTVYAPAAA